VRQLVLNSHYRSPLDFSDAALFAAQSGYNRITETVKAIRKEISRASDGQLDSQVAEQLEQLKTKFETAMNDDLNTSVALSVVFDLVRLANKLLQDGNANAQTLGVVDDLFGKLGGDVLGIVKDEYAQAAGGDDELLDKLVNNLIAERNLAREQKDYKIADKIREVLVHSDIVVSDDVNVTIWKKK
jgi:cysteinyl-tRNA synthetase